MYMKYIRNLFVMFLYFVMFMYECSVASDFVDLCKNNNKFLDSEFWSQCLDDSQVIDALY